MTETRLHLHPLPAHCSTLWPVQIAGCALFMVMLGCTHPAVSCGAARRRRRCCHGISFLHPLSVVTTAVGAAAISVLPPARHSVASCAFTQQLIILSSGERVLMARRSVSRHTPPCMWLRGFQMYVSCTLTYSPLLKAPHRPDGPAYMNGSGACGHAPLRRHPPVPHTSHV